MRARQPPALAPSLGAGAQTRCSTARCGTAPTRAVGQRRTCSGHRRASTRRLAGCRSGRPLPAGMRSQGAGSFLQSDEPGPPVLGSLRKERPREHEHASDHGANQRHQCVRHRFTPSCSADLDPQATPGIVPRPTSRSQGSLSALAAHTLSALPDALRAAYPSRPDVFLASNKSRAVRPPSSSSVSDSCWRWRLISAPSSSEWKPRN